MIPDALRAIDTSKTFLIRNPKAIRPWQHVLELISGYLQLIQSAYERKNDFGGSWNFGPNDENISTVENIISILLKKIPSSSVQLEQKSSALHEAQLLSMKYSKAEELGWLPMLSLDKSIELIVEWHLAYVRGNMFKRCHKLKITKMVNRRSNIQV